MNWLERARREIPKSPERPTANSPERPPSAVTAVPSRCASRKLHASNGSNGSAVPAWIPDLEAARDAFEERAAILEFDGGLTREEAEQAAAGELLTTRQSN